MSQIEEINLENNTKNKRNHQRRPNGFIQKKRFNRDRERPRNQDWKKNNRQDRQHQGLFEIDIYNFLAKNSISDLISDVNSRCGELVKLEILANHIKDQESETKIILKAFFDNQQSAENCYYQYNDANLDNLVLKTERRY